jgi:hypothetical protein
VNALRHLATALLAVSAILLGSCASSDGPRPIEGSTYWIGEPKQGKDTELFLKVFTSRQDCMAFFGSEPEARASVDECVPVVDRSTGTVRLAVQTLEKSSMQPYYLPLGQDHIQVSHNKRPVREGAKSGYQLTQQGPRRAGQLFILLIDGSASMYDNDAAGMTKLYKALLNPKVKDAFFPEGGQTAVVPLRFTSTVKALDGGKPVVIESKKQYDQYIKDHLFSYDRGWTHFYSSVAYAVGPLMEEKAIKDWLAIHKAEPTVVALTDGFHNQSGADTCETNVPRLQALLEELEIARSQPLGLRPSVFTVGLGKAFFSNLPEIPKGRVTPRDLCGKYRDAVINGYLEMAGVDNNSLRWIAERGGGQAFVKNNAAGLAEVFEAAAAVRYAWYSVSYKVDPFYHRQKFETRIRVTSFANADATIEIFPSGWLDAPTGERPPGERWTRPTPLRSTFALAMPILGGLVLVAFLGPAGFNARRAVFRRARGKASPSGGARKE